MLFLYNRGFPWPHQFGATIANENKQSHYSQNYSIHLLFPNSFCLWSRTGCPFQISFSYVLPKDSHEYDSTLIQLLPGMIKSPSLLILKPVTLRKVRRQWYCLLQKWRRLKNKSTEVPLYQVSELNEGRIYNNLIPNN